MKTPLVNRILLTAALALILASPLGAVEPEAIDSPSWWLAKARDSAHALKYPGTVVSTLFEIAEVQHELGIHSEERETIRGLLRLFETEPDPLRQTYWYHRAAEASLRVGDKNAALDQCRLALESARRIDDASLRAQILRQLATVQHDAGDHEASVATFEETLSAVRKLDRRLGKEDELKALGCAVAATRNDAFVRKLAPVMPRDILQGLLYFRAALAYADAGDATAARRNTQKFSDIVDGRLVELVEIQIAVSQIRRAAFGEAKATIAALPAEYDFKRSENYRGAISALISALDSPGADMLVRASEWSDTPRTHLYLELARAQAASGDKDASRESVQLARRAIVEVDLSLTREGNRLDGYLFVQPRDKRMYDIVVAQLELEDFDAAEKTAAEIAHPWVRVEGYLSIAKGYHAGGNRANAAAFLKRAIDTTDAVRELDRLDRCLLVSRAAIELESRENVASALQKALACCEKRIDPEQSARELCQVAELQLAAGDKEVCRQTLARAIEYVASIPNEGHKRVWALQEIAHIQFAAGDMEQGWQSVEVAKQHAAALTDADDRWDALHWHVVWIARAGEPDRAAKMLGELDDSQEKGRAQEEIAVSLAKAGRFTEAQERIADLKRRRWNPAKNYQKVAAFQVQAGDLAGLRKWVESLDEPEKVVAVCIAAAKGINERQRNGNVVPEQLRKDVH